MGEKLKEVPMGVSEWKAHGKKYGYDKYFIKKALKKQREEIIKKLSENLRYDEYVLGGEVGYITEEKLINTIKNI